MKRLVEFPLEGGGSIVVEVEEPEPPRGIAEAAGLVEKIVPAGQSFEAALDKIRPAVQTIIQKLLSLADLPDEANVEFGMKLNAEAGAVIAATSMEANFRVILTWKRGRKLSG